MFSRKAPTTPDKGPTTPTSQAASASAAANDGTGSAAPPRRSISTNDAQIQISALREQMEQIQLNAIKAQANTDAKLKDALGQLESVKEQLASARDQLEANEVSGSPYLKTSTAVRAVAALAVAVYISKTLSSGPVSKLTYSKSLRHIHLLMGVGIIGGIGSVQVARNLEPGPEKKTYMDIHKGSGMVMLVALFLRIVLRLRSAIPERFPGPRPLQILEGLSHRSFYLLMLILPTSGIVYNYCSGLEIPLLGVSKKEIEEEDVVKAQQAIEVHKKLGQFLEYAWLPFHFLTLAYHSGRGRSVVKRITPFP